MFPACPSVCVCMHACDKHACVHAQWMLSLTGLPLTSGLMVIMYTMRQKKGTNFLLCASFLVLDRNRRIFSHTLRKV